MKTPTELGDNVLNALQSSRTVTSFLVMFRELKRSSSEILEVLSSSRMFSV